MEAVVKAIFKPEAVSILELGLTYGVSFSKGPY